MITKCQKAGNEKLATRSGTETSFVRLIGAPAVLNPRALGLSVAEEPRSDLLGPLLGKLDPVKRRRYTVVRRLGWGTATRYANRR